MGVSPLLAMCAQPLPGPTMFENEKMDKLQSQILRCFVSRANEIDAGKGVKEQTKLQLIKACTHEYLGLNTSLHYASARGKTFLAKQLIRSGCHVNSLNRDGATPLHLACICGHTNVATELLKLNADINAQTISGETPLMLASYGLHFETALKLLESGAKPEIVGTRINILHALVTGVTRVHNITYKNISTKDEPYSVALYGFSEPFAGSSYTMGPHHLGVQNYAILQYPFIEGECHDILIFPQTMINRLEKGIAIGELLIKSCSMDMFFQQTDTGRSPCELLSHLWERFWVMHNDAITKSDIRIAACTPQQKAEDQQRWSIVLRLVHRLANMLTPDETADIDGFERNLISIPYKLHKSNKEMQGKAAPTTAKGKAEAKKLETADDISQAKKIDTTTVKSLQPATLQTGIPKAEGESKTTEKKGLPKILPKTNLPTEKKETAEQKSAELGESSSSKLGESTKVEAAGKGSETVAAEKDAKLLPAKKSLPKKLPGVEDKKAPPLIATKPAVDADLISPTTETKALQIPELPKLPPLKELPKLPPLKELPKLLPLKELPKLPPLKEMPKMPILELKKPPLIEIKKPAIPSITKPSIGEIKKPVFEIKKPVLPKPVIKPVIPKNIVVAPPPPPNML